MKTSNQPSSMKKITLLVVVLTLIALLFIFAKVATADITAKIPQDREMTGDSGFRDIRSIRHELAVLDSVTHDPEGNRRALSNTLTQVLGEKEKAALTVYEPDTLLRLIQWAEQFNYYSEYDSTGEVFCQSVYQYWFDLVTNKLAAFSKERPALRHTFKFKYLVARCYEKRFSTAVKVTDFEKFVDNILYSNWGHLINATWTQSSWGLKGVMLVMFVLMMYGAYAVGLGVFRLVKKYRQ